MMDDTASSHKEDCSERVVHVKEGKRIVLSTERALINNGRGEITGAIGQFSDISRVSQLANELIQKDFQLNVSNSADPAPYKFKINIPEDADMEANASALETLKRANIPVKKDEAYTMLGLTKTEPDDELL